VVPFEKTLENWGVLTSGFSLRVASQKLSGVEVYSFGQLRFELTQEAKGTSQLY
jgi:hypothetical protein